MILLHRNQLAGTGGGVLAVLSATVLAENNNDTDGKQITLENGSTTEVYSFTTTPSNDFEVPAGTNSLKDLVEIIKSDSVAWDAVYFTSLGGMKLAAIYPLDQSTDTPDRVFGDADTFGFIDYNGETDYSSNDFESLPTTDPAQKNFGPCILDANIQDGDTHIPRADCMQYIASKRNGYWRSLHSLATVQLSGLNPTGTSDSGGVMMGLATYNSVITPGLTGRVRCTITGRYSSTGNSTASIEIVYGVDNVPSNGDPENGTNCGVSCDISGPSGTFCIQANNIYGEIGTPTWVDPKVTSDGTETVTLSGIILTMEEF